MPSPRQSPRAQRKLSVDVRLPAGMRERKNSITEISDNEDDLLEYHRRQREERMREQEMERLVSRGARGAAGCGRGSWPGFGSWSQGWEGPGAAPTSARWPLCEWL